jgi:hypothetical protein
VTEVTVDHGRKLPVCLRKYDRGNPECDGRPHARTADERMPCVYRDRCVALQRLVRVKGYKARDLLKLRKVRDPDGKRRVYAFAVSDSEDFQLRLVRAIDRYGIRNGRITIRHPDEEIPKKPRKIKNRSEESKAKSAAALVKARKYAVAALREKARDDMGATLKLLDWFVLRLRRAARSHPYALDQGNARVGDLFLIDRVDTSRCVTLYIKTMSRGPKGNRKRLSRKPLANIVLGVRSHSLQFRFPFDRAKLESLLPSQGIKKVVPADFVEGRFLSRTCQVGKEGASLVAEVIARALNEGIIRVPKALVP